MTESRDDDRLKKRLGPFLAAADKSPMATLFTDGTDSGNPIVHANPAFLTLTGFSASEVNHKPLADILGDLTDSTTVATICSILAGWGSGSCEMQCRRREGSEFLAAGYVSPVHDCDGLVLHNVLSIVELGGHVERLLDQRNEFHAIYERAPGFIATSEGPEHRITFANEAYKKFVGRDHLVGLTVAEAMPEIARQNFVALLDEVYRTGTPFVGRGVPTGLLDPATGQLRTRYCDFVYEPVRDGGKRIIGLFCEGYDVTEQRKTADALTKLQSELIQVARINTMGAMAATLAHELNQPLTAIANYAAGSRRLIDQAQGGNQRLADALTGIEEATQRAAEIIRNLRELTQGREPVRGEFDLKTAAAECVRLVHATAPGVTMIETIPEGITVCADRVQIQQVIINLLRNASEALDRDGLRRIAITAAIDSARLVVSVADTGSGVPEGTADDIFASIESTKEGGMGLGLRISCTIIEAHGGTIWLESTGKQGSTFCFSLPHGPRPDPA